MTGEERLPRFPGSRPFGGTELERSLFRGREQEAEELLNAILSGTVTVLFSESGAGKTSLLEAAVHHELRALAYWPVVLRLNDPSTTPLDLIREQLAAQAKADGLDMLGVDPAVATLRDHVAAMEVWRGASLLTPVLVFDQFEELFTLGWDSGLADDFIADVGRLARGTRGVSPAAPAVKIVFSIREDSLGSLEALATDIPRILANRFRLLRLGREAAKRAIVEPAALADVRLASRPFAFAPEALELIVEFVGREVVLGEEVPSRTVGASQLQIICSHVERKIRPDKPDPATITDADLGGEEGLRRILTDFYADQLALLPPAAVGKARDLCETALISGGRRLSLDEEVVTTEHGVPTDVLDVLVRSTLLRVEPRLGSRYYELAHDSLVVPILAYRAKLATDKERRRQRRRELASVTFGIVAFVAILAFSIGRAILDSGEDFADQDLIRQSFVGRDDLAEADFTEADLTRADFTDVDLEMADFSGAILRNARLVDADLTDATLTGADLTGADLTGARLKRADLSRTELRGAVLAGTNLENANLASARGEDADLSTADLGRANLTGADLDRARLHRATLARATLDSVSLGTDLTFVDLDNVNLSRAILVEADLSGRDLREQSFVGSNLLAATLAGANLAGVDLSAAALRFADLSDANLDGARLVGANLRGAVLRRAHLVGTDLRGADLTDADLTATDLSLADLADAMLDGVTFDASTTWPAGFVPPTS